jgi:GNAT superfamily N-acetyltransferase
LTRLDQVSRELPAGFDDMQAEARSEGHQFLGRLAADWTSGIMRFGRDGEALLVAYVDGALAGIGGITIDPFLPGALRMRRFYVRPPFRRCSIARQLATSLIGRAVRDGRPITVNAPTGGASLFWQSLGFASDHQDSHTHILRSGK